MNNEFYLMQCLHHSNMDDQRDKYRAEHRAWVKSGGNGLAIVLVGSAVLDEQGGARGHFGILEAPSEAQAMAFAEGDPFNRGGIVASIRLERLPDTFQADRITNPMTSRDG